MHKALVFFFSIYIGLKSFSLMIFSSKFNDFSIFPLSFPTKLGGFLLIDLSGFLSRFSY